ncbi:hypothetical protein NOVA_03975 [Nocardia nova]|uniref:hypothetical protein n=1 Tax=Nocardia nova TaxID=37330 RepID=UPI001C443575|nr:hypothetical protein [Nocardia nova]MBV7701919.1 hypothetical protein [Nocardia nova]
MITAANPSTFIGVVLQEFRHVRADVPAGLTAALDALDSTYDLTGKVPDKTDTTIRRELAAAAAAALAAGTDLAADKTIRELLARAQLADIGVRSLIAEQVEELRRDVLVDHADELLNALGEAFDQAADEVQTARDAIGPALDLSSADAVSIAPASHMTTWGRAYEATQRIGRIGKLWEMIAQFAGKIGGIQNQLRPLLAADLTAAQLDEISGDKPTVISAVVAGFPLELATPAEFIERCQRVRDEWETEPPKPPRPSYLGVNAGRVVNVA